MFAVGKSGRNDTFNLIFLGLGWPWVGEFDGFIKIFICFPTQQNLVNRKHPTTPPWTNLEADFLRHGRNANALSGGGGVCGQISRPSQSRRK